MKLLITGTAGFIGYHLAKRLAREGHTIVCIYNINNYYDLELKYARLSALGFERKKLDSAVNESSVFSSIFPSLSFKKIDLCNAKAITDLFSKEQFDMILHLAAQAGVRYSLTNPQEYISSNIQGFLSILEAARLYPPKHLVYASSSSVYGLNTKIPFSENDTVNQPANLYAATKRSNELMAFTYSSLYHIPVTGMRFFTVYGPWGRPDMAPVLFAKSILEEKPINVFNNGNMKRDFTYIDDIIEGMVRIMNRIPPLSAETNTAAAIYNIGNGKPVELMDFIHLLEKALDKKAILQYSPMQMGDINTTWADCSSLEKITGYRPQTDLSEGIKQFVSWYKDYYQKG